MIWTFFLIILNWAQAQTCPGSDEVQALMSLKYQGANRLFVCGFEDPTQKAPKGKRHLSNFGVFFETPEQVRKVFSVPAAEAYWVSMPKKNQMLFEEVVWVADRYVPIFSSVVSCTPEECVRSESACAPTKGKKSKDDILREIDKKIRGKFSRVPQPVSMMIEMALAQVLAGDLNSARLFESDEIMDKVDVPAGQQFLVSKKIYNKVKSAGCLKVRKKK